MLGVLAALPEDGPSALTLAHRLQLCLLPAHSQPRRLAAGQLVLRISRGVPELCMTGPRAPGPVRVDFQSAALALRRRAGHNELLGRAVGWKQAHAPRVLDATGGYGRDALVLADQGCDVLVCEREPVMAALLEDALERARSCGEGKLEAAASRIQLYAGDARALSDAALQSRDVIYLDPMFPESRKAAPAKEMQVLHRLLTWRAVQRGASTPDYHASADALLRWARQQAVRRVVVKRPRRAGPVGDLAPGHSLCGKAVRFDVYPLS